MAVEGQKLDGSNKKASGARASEKRRNGGKEINSCKSARERERAAAAARRYFLRKAIFPLFIHCYMCDEASAEFVKLSSSRRERILLNRKNIFMEFQQQRII
jgi:hypothetical protein